MFLCHIRSYLVLILLTSLVVLTILKTTPKVTKSDDSKTKRFRKKEKNETIVAKLPLYNVISWKSASELGLESKTWRMRQVSASIREPIVPYLRPLHLSISRSHWIYSRRGWDAAPIVIPKYRLIFFTTPKVACTAFKQLFLRMMGDTDWRRWDVHNPTTNGLRYLYHYSIEQASNMITSNKWKKAIFVRDPRDRILSAYLDKAISNNSSYVIRRCCPKFQSCGPVVRSSFTLFLHVAHVCPDPHWEPQMHRMEGRYWPFIDFVGHLETAAIDTKALLMELGVRAWEDYGASGWGINGTEPIFHSTGTVRHSTNSMRLRSHYYNQETTKIVKRMFFDDFRSSLFAANQTIHGS